MKPVAKLAVPVFVLLTACSGAAAEPTQVPTVAPTTVAAPTTTSVTTTATMVPLSRYSAEVEAWQVANDVVGAVILVVGPDGAGRPIATGFSDRQAATPMIAGERFRIGSITKVYTAALVMRLVEDGALELDGSVSEYLSNFPEQVTVRQLLSHTAGLRDVDVAAGIFEAIESGGLPESDGDPIDTALANGLAFDPGTQQSYSSIGYLALERVIEAATGLAWDEVLAQLVLGSDVGTQLEEVDSAIPTPYERLGSASPAISLAGFPTAQFARGAGAAGGLIASAEDVARFVRRLFAGEVVAAASLEAMIEVAPPLSDYGLGLAIYEVAGAQIFGHNGRTIGFASSVRHDPAANVTVVVLSNDGAAPTDELAQLLIKEALSDQ